MIGALHQLRRQAAFARHVPPRQIARRLQLTMRRRYERILKPSLAAGPVERQADPPLPLFPPRRGMLDRSGGQIRIRLLGGAYPIDPALGSGFDPARERRLLRMTLHYMEYLEEAEDPEFCAWVRGWISANPPYSVEAVSDAWSAYALSLRVVVWMQQLAARAGRLPTDVVEEAELSLAEQLVYLDRHLETDIGGNHLIKNIKALLWGSAYFQGPAAKHWRHRGIALLERELRRQILPDGVHFELSPAYHGQVFADLLEICRAVAGAGGIEALDEALKRAAPAVADLCHPDGAIAQFGDSGLSMAYRPALSLDAFAALYGKAPAPRPVFAFPDAGYYGLRSDGDYLVVDAGRIGPDALPGHAHADAFSFEWSVGGQRLVVDQGVFEYVAGAKRQWSRSTAAHNTVAVEGADQADFFGDFRRGARARVEVVSHSQSNNGFALEARHDGFRRLAGGPIHTRRFEASPTRVRITDQLDKSWPGAAALMLFAPEATVRQVTGRELLVTCGPAMARITGSADFQLEEAIWWPDLGVERRTCRAVMEFGPGVTQARLELSGHVADEGRADEAD